MAERLRSTGRKSKSAAPRGASPRRGLGGAKSATISHAAAAKAAAVPKAPRQPSQRSVTPASKNDTPPATPMLAAWPATARDISAGSTRSARSFSPVMYVPAQPTPDSARARAAPHGPSTTSAKAPWLITVNPTPVRYTARGSTRSVRVTSIGTDTVYAA